MLTGNPTAQLKLLLEGSTKLAPLPPALPGTPFIAPPKNRAAAVWQWPVAKSWRAVREAVATLHTPGVDEHLVKVDRRDPRAMGYCSKAIVAMAKAHHALRQQMEVAQQQCEQLGSSGLLVQARSYKHARTVALHLTEVLQRTTQQAAVRVAAASALYPAQQRADAVCYAAAYLAVMPLAHALAQGMVSARTRAAEVQMLKTVTVDRLFKDGHDDDDDEQPDTGCPAIISPSGGSPTPAVVGTSTSSSGRQRSNPAALMSHPLLDLTGDDDDQESEEGDKEEGQGDKEGKEDGEAGAPVRAPRGGGPRSDDEGAAVDVGGSALRVALVPQTAAAGPRRRSTVVAAACFVGRVFGRRP